MSPSRGVQLPPFRFHLVKDEDLSLCCALGVGGLVYTRYAPFQIRRDLQGQKMRGRRWEGFCQRRPGGRIGILPLRGANVVRPGSVQRYGYGVQMSCSAHRGGDTPYLIRQWPVFSASPSNELHCYLLGFPGPPDTQIANTLKNYGTGIIFFHVRSEPMLPSCVRQGPEKARNNLKFLAFLGRSEETITITATARNARHHDGTSPKPSHVTIITRDCHGPHRVRTRHRYRSQMMCHIICDR